MRIEEKKIGSGMREVLGDKWERLFFFFVLLLHSGVSASTAHIHYLNTSVFFLLYGAMFLLVFTDIKRWLSHFSTHIFLFLMIIWAVLSITWSTNVYLTFLGLVSLIGMLLISFYLSDKFSLEDVLDLLVSLGFIVLFINAIALLFFPEQSFHHLGPLDGSWKGLFGHKNSFGMFFYCFSIIFLLALYFKRPMNKAGLYLALFLSIIFLYQSKSTTSWMAMGLFAGLFGLKWLNAKKNIQWRWFFVSLVIIASGLFFYAAQFLDLFGKNLTFTGRTRIWTGVWEVIQQNRWIGNGYLGFWYDRAHSIPHWPVGLRAHNGYLEVMLYFGFTGFFLFFLMWGRALFLSAKLFLSDQMTLQSIFPFLFLATYSVQNAMESSFFSPRNLLWILFVYFIIYLNNHHSRQQSS